MRHVLLNPKKMIWEKMKLLQCRTKNKHGLGIQRKSGQKIAYFGRFWVIRGPVIQKPFQTIPTKRFASTVAHA